MAAKPEDIRNENVEHAMTVAAEIVAHHRAARHSFKHLKDGEIEMRAAVLCGSPDPRRHRVEAGALVLELILRQDRADLKAIEGATPS